MNRKNGFLHFVFSFVPGAGEMYMGFMKMGFSLMCIFAVLCAVVSLISIPELAIFPAMFYVYCFFHTHNIRGLDDAKFGEVVDEYLFNLDKILQLKEDALKKGRKWIAALCVILGAVMLWQAGLEFLWDTLGGKYRIVRILSTITDYMPRTIIGIAIVVLGIKLIKGRPADE